jgi:hypothetical protein
VSEAASFRRLLRAALVVGFGLREAVGVDDERLVFAFAHLRTSALRSAACG